MRRGFQPPELYHANAQQSANGRAGGLQRAREQGGETGINTAKLAENRARHQAGKAPIRAFEVVETVGLNHGLVQRAAAFQRQHQQFGGRAPRQGSAHEVRLSVGPTLNPTGQLAGAARRRFRSLRPYRRPCGAGPRSG